MNIQYAIDRFQMLRNCYLRNRALKISNHKTFKGPWGPMRAQWGHWAHGPNGLLGWGTTRRELKVPSGVAPRNCYFKALRVLCREFRNSLTSEKGVPYHIPVLLATMFSFLLSARFQNMSPGTKLAAKDTTDAKTPAIFSLRDPNLGEDVPD